MGLNHRYVLRVVTDGALGLFVLSAAGVVLWVTDEFLGWNVLPDWVDKYAQLIVVLFGMAAGLAMGASLLCSVALLAEAAAERAGIRDYRTPPRVGRTLGILVVIFAAGLFAFYRIDLYRKEVGLREARKMEAAQYEERMGQFRTMLPRMIELFPASLVEAMTAGNLSEQDPELITFLSAIQSSMAHHPQVLVLTRARAPYRYCRYTLKTRANDAAGDALGRYYLEKQFYTGFPSETESQAVSQLFAEGTAPPLEERLEGEVLNNVRPGAWGPLLGKGEVAGLLVIRGDFPNRFGLFHSGQSASTGRNASGEVTRPKLN
jgi:hypothetical protein